MLSANIEKSKSRIMKGSLLAKKNTIKFFGGDNELQIFQRCTARTIRLCEAEFTWAICMPQPSGWCGNKKKCQEQSAQLCSVESKRYLI